MSVNITRVSLNSSGQQINDAFLYVDTEISPDGRYIAFLTDSPTLTPNMPPKGSTSTPGYWFIKDTQTGHVARVEAEKLIPDSGFTPAALKYNYDVSLSNGAGVVTYGSYAARFNLDTGAIINQVDVPDKGDFFTTAYTSGTSGYVYSDSYYYDVGSGTINGHIGEIEAVETSTGAVSKLKFSLNYYADKKDGMTDLSVVEEPRFSDASSDGRYLSIEITARGIKSSENSADYGLIGNDYGVYDRNTQTFTRLTNTIASAAEGFNANTSFIEDPYYDTHVSDISDDGSTIVFSSNSNNFVSGDTNNNADIFAIDTRSKVATRISVTIDGRQLSGDSIVPSISGDGHYVLFVSSAPELGPANALYIRDMHNGQIKRVDMTIDGKSAGVSAKQAEISYDGKYIVFSSGYSNYVSDDTNNVTDVFRAENPFLDSSSQPPVDIKLSSASVFEFAKNGTTVGALSAVDADANDTFTYKLLDDAGGRFLVSGNALKVADGLLLDYEQAQSDTVTVRVTDKQGNTFDKVLTIAVKDVNPEVITGSSGTDTFVGGASNDTFDGAAGNDILNGGLGADKTTGGLGNDIYYVDNVGDTVIESSGAGTGTDIVHTTLNTYTLSDNVEQLIFDGTGGFTATGNASDNKLTGGTGDDKFFTDGHTTSQPGSDVFGGGTGTDAVFYTKAAIGAVINLQSGTNGGAAAGDIYGSIEKFFGSNIAADTMTASNAGRATFSGQGGNDVLTGGATVDQLFGGAGNDTLKGNGGIDQLAGGLGNDIMDGGAGRDLFVFVEAKFGVDTINNFEDGQDRLKVFSAVATDISAFTITGNDTTAVTLKLASDPTNVITIKAASAIHIDVNDFLFY